VHDLFTKGALDLPTLANTEASESAGARFVAKGASSVLAASPEKNESVTE
jgi:hypothetical protein